MKRTMTDREKYDLLMQAARTAPKGKLLQTAAALLGALWGARVTRNEAIKREQQAYDEGFNDAATRKPRRWAN